MAIRTECKSRFPSGTILAGFSPDSSAPIGRLHETLGTYVVNGFAHGASSVVATFDREAGFWTIDCDVPVERFAVLAGFDAAAPFELFLALRTTAAIVRRSMRGSVVLHEHRRRRPRWQTIIVYNLDEICAEAADILDDEPFTLDGFAALCASAITRAIGSGGHTIRFEFFPKAMTLVTGDDGRTDDPVRSDDQRFEDFKKRNMEILYTHYGRMQAHAEA